MQWKSEQYERTGRCDRFSRKWVRDLVGRLEDLREPGCQGVLSTLSTGGRLVAAHFGIRTQTRLSGWFPAYDVSFSQYSPGLQLFLFMAESASAHGVELIDLGKGDESYKAEIGSWTYPVACGRVEAHADLELCLPAAGPRAAFFGRVRPWPPPRTLHFTCGAGSGRQSPRGLSPRLRGSGLAGREGVGGDQGRADRPLTGEGASGAVGDLSHDRSAVQGRQAASPRLRVGTRSVVSEGVSGSNTYRTHVARHSGHQNGGVCAWSSLVMSSMPWCWRAVR